MKKILFPATNRVHIARQKLLLEELKKHFEVIVTLGPPHDPKTPMNVMATIYDRWFLSEIAVHKPDLVLIRGDRFEMLPLAMSAVYSGVKVAHIEGGDQSGVIDNKVRHAVTQLSDYHFATNKESYARLIRMGSDPDTTFDFGSLDVEYANSLKLEKPILAPYVVVSFHPFPEEDGKLVQAAIKQIPSTHSVKTIGSNADYGMEYKGESYTSEEYLALIKYADLLIGNSSSFLKEASVFGTPVVDVGTRQQNRLKPQNVLSVPYEKDSIIAAIKLQIGRVVPSSDVYLKPDTSYNITMKLLDLIDKKYV